MKYQPNPPSALLPTLFLVMVFLLVDTCLSCAPFMSAVPGRPVSLLTVGVSDNKDGRRFRTDLRSSYRTATYLFESDIAVYHSMDGGDGDESAAGISDLSVRFSGRLTSTGGLRIQIGWLRPVGLAYELFNPMAFPSVSPVSSGGTDERTFFGFPTASSSRYMFPGIASEYSAMCGILGSTSFGVSVGFPPWVGRAPLTSLLLMESQPLFARIAVSLLYVHKAVGGDGDVPRNVSVDWVTLYPFLACVALVKVESGAIPFLGFSVRSGMSFRVGFDRFIGYGATSGWSVEAKRLDFEVKAYWKHDAGGFQLALPVGPQQRPVQLLRLILRHETACIRVECQYDDVLYQSPVHGGLSQRRRTTGDMSISVSKDGASCKLFVKDVTTWFPDGRRSGVHTFGLQLKHPVHHVPVELTGEVSWLRGGGTQPELFRGYGLVLDVGTAHVAWDGEELTVSLKFNDELPNGRLTCSIDTERRFSLTFSLSI